MCYHWVCPPPPPPPPMQCECIDVLPLGLAPPPPPPTMQCECIDVLPLGVASSKQHLPSICAFNLLANKSVLGCPNLWAMVWNTSGFRCHSVVSLTILDFICSNVSCPRNMCWQRSRCSCLWPTSKQFQEACHSQELCYPPCGRDMPLLWYCQT